ncbi:MAG: four helix bundle protein [Chitinispirillia bacterium]|nr:four helix bundle protein [Chitinispirillia bacterium]
MKTENILTIEEAAENRINLVRDSLFWQAWSKSAFLFVTHIKKYQVQKRFIQKVSQEVVWIGFPRSVLANIEKISKEKGWTYEQKSADHIIIDGVPAAGGYEKWWADIVRPMKYHPASMSGPPVNKGETKKVAKNEPQLLAAYKTAYDLCIDIYKATAKISKEYRYEIGARVRGYATNIVEDLHILCNVKPNARVKDSRAEPILLCVDTIHRLRIDIRILGDLKEFGIKQWGALNQQIENLLDNLRAEFCNSNKGLQERVPINQSGGTLTTAY